MDKIYIVALLFICAAYPILLFIYIWQFPIYVIISYFAWIILSLGWIIFSNRKKLSEYIVPIILFDLVFTIIFASGTQDVLFWEDETVMSWIAPSLCLPAIIYIGIKLGAVHADSIKEKEENLRKAFKTCIEQIIYEISKFEEQLNKCNISDKTTSSLIQLLAICTNDNSLKTLYDNANNKIFDSHIDSFKGIIPDDDMPQNKELFDLYVAQQLKKETEYRDILNRINTYDYKGLKTLYSQHKN